MRQSEFRQVNMCLRQGNAELTFKNLQWDTYVQLYFIFTAIVYAYGCGKCEKLDLTDSEKD